MEARWLSGRRPWGIEEDPRGRNGFWGMGPDTWVPSLSLRTPDQESAEQRPSEGKGALGQLKSFRHPQVAFQETLCPGLLGSGNAGVVGGTTLVVGAQAGGRHGHSGGQPC